MGVFRMGPPEELILELNRHYKFKTFIETGTFRGGTTQWASKHFQSVITIENSKLLFEKASKMFANEANITCLYGDSRIQLRKAVDSISSSAVFWLDSHWCGGESYGESDQCPLMEEINILNSLSEPHLLFIDDARLFTSPPPLPNRIDSWPTIADVCRSLDQGTFDRYVVIFEDVVIAVPKKMKVEVANWCQAINTEAWHAYGNKLNQPKWQKGLGEIYDGIRLIALHIRTLVLQRFF